MITALEPLTPGVQTSARRLIYSNGSEVLFSYQTPVGVWNDQKSTVYVTKEKYSVTTTKHINQWLALHHFNEPTLLPEEELREEVGKLS